MPFTVKEILHLTADDLARRFVEMTKTGHDVFLFLFKNGFRSNIRFRLFPHGKTPFKNIPKIQGQIEFRLWRKRKVPMPNLRGDSFSMSFHASA